MTFDDQFIKWKEHYIGISEGFFDRKLCLKLKDKRRIQSYKYDSSVYGYGKDILIIERYCKKMFELRFKVFNTRQDLWAKLSKGCPEFSKPFDLTWMYISEANSFRKNQNHRIKRGPKNHPDTFSIALLWIMKKAGTSNADRLKIYDYIARNGAYEKWFNDTYSDDFPFNGFSLNRISKSDFGWFSILRQNLERNLLGLRKGNRSVAKLKSDNSKLAVLLEKFEKEVTMAEKHRSSLFDEAKGKQDLAKLFSRKLKYGDRD